jgi:hypothetical protein
MNKDNHRNEIEQDNHCRTHYNVPTQYWLHFWVNTQYNTKNKCPYSGLQILPIVKPGLPLESPGEQ